MQSHPIISEQTVGAAFELRLYGSRFSKPAILLQARRNGSYHCFAGRSVKDLKEVSVFFSDANTCHIRTLDGIFQFHVRPISIKSLFSPKPDAQIKTTSTDNPEITASTVDDVVDNKPLLPEVAAHSGKPQPLASEDSFSCAHIMAPPYAMPGRWQPSDDIESESGVYPTQADSITMAPILSLMTVKTEP